MSVDTFKCRGIAKYPRKCYDIKRGDWVYGYYVSHHDNQAVGRKDVHAILKIIYGDWGMFHYDEIEVYADTVCRSTGRCDINDNDIFEGDILKIPAGYFGDSKKTESIDVVEWSSDYQEIGFSNPFPDDVDYSDCLIVGSIHQDWC